MTYYIGSARHDENGRYRGGKAGDQTGQEVATQKMYNYPTKGGWICWRFKNPAYAIAMKEAMLRYCADNRIGYSMSDRYGLIRDLKQNGKVTKNVNTDCSSLIRACIYTATDGTDVGDFTTADEGAILQKSGLFTKVGKVTTHSDLYDGDILVTAKQGHTVAVTSGISRTTTKERSSREKIAQIRAKGVRYARNFCASISTKDNEDIIRVKVLQHGLNLDYKSGLKEDGIFGNKTGKALGSHYVKKGEKQYMVSVAEIFCYMSASDPKGYECPGVYGKGLKSATGRTKLDADWFIKMVQ